MPSSRSRSIRRALLALSLAVYPAPTLVHAQAGTPGCTLNKDLYTCNWQSFRSALQAAHTIQVETQRLDRSTAAQLRRLAQSLGKTVAAPGQPADLTFLLIPVESNGVDFGPAGRDLATLRIYAPGPNTTRGTLLWAETYRGQPDRPWPAIANATIEQFQSRLHHP